jgi:ACS family tartrate transporter-like MFS transporter
MPQVGVLEGRTGGAAPGESPLDRARRKAYRRLLPLCFISYVIAYVDRSNVAIAKLTMSRDLPGFDNAVIGFGAGVFFIGYFLLEIPGTLLVERWSARKWLARIMITWGITAALTAGVKTPMQFYVVRFFLGLAEAGFYPGVIVYLTHWFASRDRARALAYFFVATPVAQIISPKISNALLKIGTDEVIGGVRIHHPEVLGLEGWQWVYIAWGIPAVILGVLVLLALTDRPEQATWLAPEERDALLAELQREKAARPASHHVKLLAAMRDPKVIVLATVYFFAVTGSYGVEFFMPSILERWYALKFDALTWLVILPPLLALFGQLFVGWSSDRSRERRLHTAIPMAAAALGLLLVTASRGNLPLTVIGFMISYAGFKAYLPAFWSLPSLFLTDTAAAGCIGLINSVGNLGGFMGPFVLGTVEKLTGSFEGGLFFLIACMAGASFVVFRLTLGGAEPRVVAGATDADPAARPAAARGPS